jgi:hypothetical protein
MESWVAKADIVLAACSAAAAVFWLWIAKGEGIAIITALLVLLTAAAFVLAHIAIKRNWRRQWSLQLLGPTMAIFLLFGTLWALVSVVVLALVGRVALRRIGPRRNAAS